MFLNQTSRVSTQPISLLWVRLPSSDQILLVFCFSFFFFFELDFPCFDSVLLVFWVGPSLFWLSPSHSLFQSFSSLSWTFRVLTHSFSFFWVEPSLFWLSPSNLLCQSFSFSPSHFLSQSIPIFKVRLFQWIIRIFWLRPFFCQSFPYFLVPLARFFSFCVLIWSPRARMTRLKMGEGGLEAGSVYCTIMNEK